MSILKKEIEAESNIELDVVEIGPGLGDLSIKILDCFSLIAYEIDSELYLYLKDRFPRLKLYNKDVLSIPFNNNGWLHNKEYILVSNLPYYIATKIILNVLRDKLCRGMIVMTQREVADKFCAKFNDSSFCAISIITESISKSVSKIALVPPNAFSPIPKVESTIFAISKNNNYIDNEFESMIKKAFCSPRKKVIKNLSHIQNLDEILNKLNISNNARAHQINTLQYHQIFNIIKEEKWKEII